MALPHSVQALHSAVRADPTEGVRRLQERLERLGGDRVSRHCRRMQMLGADLALNWGLSVLEMQIAIWGHDQYRLEGPAGWLALAERHGLQPDPIERRHPLLLHGPLAACLLSGEFGVTQPDVLSAVRYHTTLRESPGVMEMALYVVDKTEPGKPGEDNAEIFKLAYRDLPSACARLAKRHRDKTERRDAQGLHPDTEAFLRWAETRP